MLDNKELEDKGWGLMLDRLDDEMPERKAIAWWRYLGLLLLLLGVGFGYSILFNDGQVNTAVLETPTQFVDHSNKLMNAIDSPVVVEKVTEDNSQSVVQPTASKLSSSKLMNPKVSAKEQTQLWGSTQDADQPSSTNQQEQINLKAIEDQENQAFANTSNGNDEALGGEIRLAAKWKKEESAVELAYSADANDSMSGSISSATMTTSPRTSQFKVSTRYLAPLSSKNSLAISSVVLPIRTEIKAPIAERIVSTFVAIETSYLSDFEQLSLSLSLLSEVGSSQSPWSFTSGLSYQRVAFSSFQLSNFESAFLSAADRDTTLEETLPTNNTGYFETIERRSIGSLNTVDYIGIPLLFSYRMNRLQIGLGIENNFAVRKNFSAGDSFFTNDQYIDLVYNYQLNFVQEINVNMTSRFQVGIRTRFDLTGAHGYDANYFRNLHQFGLQLKYQIQ